jgi:hypothetical protein
LKRDALFLATRNRAEPDTAQRNSAAERLGHSRVALTLDRYSHVIPGMQEKAVAVVDAAFQQALNRGA